MRKEGQKAPRKTYAKPRIAIEDFTLNQFIANCTIKTRNNPSWESQLQSYSPFIYSYMKATGQFGNGIECTVDAEVKVTDENAGMDTLCYHTSTSPLFTS